MQVPAELKNAFESLALDELTIRHKFQSFAGAIHDEQKALAIKARDIWTEARQVMNLPEGEWQYQDGEISPVVSPIPPSQNGGDPKPWPSMEIPNV